MAYVGLVDVYRWDPYPQRQVGSGRDPTKRSMDLIDEEPFIWNINGSRNIRCSERDK